MPVACRVLSESRVTKVQPPSPAALPRQQVKTPLRWSDAESAVAAEVSRQRRMLVASEVAARALTAAVPTVVLAGEVTVGRRELSAAGITAAYAVGETPEEVRAALADPVGSLHTRAVRVARTWSR